MYVNKVTKDDLNPPSSFCDILSLLLFALTYSRTYTHCTKYNSFIRKALNAIWQCVHLSNCCCYISLDCCFDVALIAHPIGRRTLCTSICEVVDSNTFMWWFCEEKKQEGKSVQKKYTLGEKSTECCAIMLHVLLCYFLTTTTSRTRQSWWLLLPYSDNIFVVALHVFYCCRLFSFSRSHCCFFVLCRLCI